MTILVDPDGRRVALAPGNETVVATSVPVETDEYHELISLCGRFYVESHLGTMSISVRVRRGHTSADPQIACPLVTCAYKFGAYVVDVRAYDENRNSHDSVYVLTAQLNTASDVCYVTSASLLATPSNLCPIA